MSEDVLKQFGAIVRERRIKQGLTQEELADRCGLHWTYIGGLERGEKNPTLRTLSRISEGLGLPLRDLFERRTKPRAERPDEKAQAAVAKLLKGEDSRTVRLAVDVLRDVIGWKDRYGRRQ